MSSQPFDLLRDKREELGLLDPVEASALTRSTLFKGLAIGIALVGGSLTLGVFFWLRSSMQASQIERLGTVEAELEQLESRLRDQRDKLTQINTTNQDLVKGLVASRSGSALMRALQVSVPRGIQLTEATEDGQVLNLKGLARDPQAFERINALQLDLKRSPLIDPNQVRLVKGSRQTPQARSGTPVSTATPVDFELRVGFRPSISPIAEKAILQELGSDGLARRLDLLQQEGLLQ
jgi:type IV pilus assembly protein PilN